MHDAAAFASSGQGCAIVYATCARIGAHSNSDNHALYRSEEELAAARDRDPLPIFRSALVADGHVKEARLDEIDAEARAQFELSLIHI